MGCICDKTRKNPSPNFPINLNDNNKKINNQTQIPYKRGFIGNNVNQSRNNFSVPPFNEIETRIQK